MAEKRGFWCEFTKEGKYLDLKSPGDEYVWIQEVAEYIWDDRVVQDAPKEASE